ncbi:hypothetical protein ECZU36_58740 [Escherichia coli]|nr:hypothetical protein ECZU36_58740 [Escherichia coli]
MMKSDEKYQVPVWMRPLLPLLCNTGGNDPEELLNDTATTVSANVVRYVLIVAVRSQVDLLQILYRKGLLRTEIPGGFSPEEAQALLDNLVRSQISRALSGERMAARDRNADLASDSTATGRCRPVCPCHTGGAWDGRRRGNRRIRKKSYAKLTVFS